MSTIYDVSKHAGVSVATVSRVLNANPKVDLALRKRVLESIRQLEFVPNGTARSLKTGRTQRVALVIPDINNPFFPGVARGAQSALEAHNYHLILSNTDDDLLRQNRYLQMLGQVGVDGLIITPSAWDSETNEAYPHSLERQLEGLGVPVVGLSVQAIAAGADHVRTDEQATGFKATEHLIERGHRRIALIQGPTHSDASQARSTGYLEALKAYGLEANPTLRVQGHARRDGGHAAMMELLQLERRPSAVFAINDLMALGAMTAIHEFGLHIPRDIAVVGVDDIPEAASAYPSLSTVALSSHEQGRVAAELLLERILRLNGVSGIKDLARTITLETHLKVRDSSLTKYAAGDQLF